MSARESAGPPSLYISLLLSSQCSLLCSSSSKPLLVLRSLRPSHANVLLATSPAGAGGDGVVARATQAAAPGRADPRRGPPRLLHLRRPPPRRRSAPAALPLLCRRAAAPPRAPPPPHLPPPPPRASSSARALAALLPGPSHADLLAPARSHFAASSSSHNPAAAAGFGRAGVQQPRRQAAGVRKM